MPTDAYDRLKAPTYGLWSYGVLDMTGRVRLTEARVSAMVDKAEADARAWKARVAEAAKAGRAAPPPPRTFNVTDAICDGLIVRVQGATGHASFMHRARLPGGKHPVRRLLGHCRKMSLERSRELCRENWEHVRRGEDPRDILRRRKTEAATARVNTVEKVVEDWIAEYVNNPTKPHRQARETSRIARREIVGPLGRKSVVSLTQEDCVSLVKAIRDRGATYVGHATYSVLRSCMRWCAAQKSYGIQASPTDWPVPIQIGLILPRRQKRRRYLNEAETRAWLIASGEQAEPWRQFFQLTAHTALRRDNLAFLEWGEVFLDDETPHLRIPAEKVKMDKDLLLPLSPQAEAILRSVKRYKGPFVLTSSWGLRGLSGFGQAKAKVEARMLAILKEDDPAAVLPAFWSHDWRRNCKEAMSRLGIAREVSEAALGHSAALNPTEAHYQVYEFFAEKAQAFRRYGAYLDAVRDRKTADVLPMRKRGKAA